MKDNKTRKEIHKLVCELAVKEDWQELSPFIKDLFKLARKTLVLKHYEDGKKDTQIKNITGIPFGTIAPITSLYWEEKMNNKKD